MKRLSYALFAALAYAIFLLTFLWLIAFVAGVPALPRSIDHPATLAPTWMAVGIDVMLIGVFGLQHSLMARSGFKAAWTRVVPQPIERSAYMIFTCAALILMFICWQPLSAPVWDVRTTALEPLSWAIFATGWLIVLLSTFLINHFELFGLQQVFQHWHGRETTAPVFRQPLFYRLVRHPLYSGFLLAFWATPMMTVGHLIFTIGMTAYIVIAIEFEERDLIRLFGTDYERYRATVGKLSPRWGRRAT